MDDAKVVETFKSAAQCTRYAGEIALQIVKLIDGQADNSLIQSLISSPDSEQGQETKQIIEEVVTRILQIKTDPWKREKEVLCQTLWYKIYRLEQVSNSCKRHSWHENA